MSEIHALLVEDDNSLRECLAELLELSGIMTDGVNCAMACYQALNTKRYDIAIIDEGLPDQSGLRIVEFLHENTNIGIILLTASGSVTDRIEGYNKGADHFFVKPIRSAELAAAIKSLNARLLKNTTQIKSDIINWYLDKTSWNLICPEGNEVKMTAKEMAFMNELMSSAGKNISRQSLLKTLEYPANEYGSRSMDSMLRRLRKKAKQVLYKPLPIQTVHSVGYCFSSPAILLTGD